MPKRLTTDQFVKKAISIHGALYDYSLVDYKTAKTKVTIICPVHGEFYMTPNNHTHKTNPQGCPQCVSRCLTTEEFISKAVEVHGNTYDYSLTKYVDSSTNIDIICPIHGVFTKIPYNHLYSKQGCSKCGKIRSIGNKPKLTKENFVNNANKVHDFIYDYSKSVYKDSRTKLIVTCPEHGDFKITPNNHVRGRKCPSCASSGFSKHKPARLYYLDINQGQAYKIGITNRTVKSRFCTKDLEIINILFELELPGSEAYLLERKILETFKHFKLKNVNILSSGNTELFYCDVFKNLPDKELITINSVYNFIQKENNMTKPFYWVTDNTRNFLAKGYLSKGESVESRIKDIADHAQDLLQMPGFSDKFYDYMSKGYYSLSSPVWSNFGKSRGFGVSCFGSTATDSVPGILQAASEIGAMSKVGGGTAIYEGNLRPRGSAISDNGESTGAVHFLELFQAITDVISQGSQRRGRTAAYLPIDHGDIEEFLNIATEGHPVQNMNTAVVVPEGWMQSMIDGDSQKRSIWAKVLKQRSEIGFPYVMFKDNANNHTKPDVYKEKNLEIDHSQLCSEIFLNTDANHSFVCVLSSMNLLHYEEWKDTDAVETMIYFLDAVVTDFLRDLEAYKDSDDPDKREMFSLLERAYNFAKRERALGLGVLGWHSYLQSNMLSFESREAAQKNLEIAKLMKEKSLKASQELAFQFGEPSLLKGYGRRNSALLAIAPTTSSAFILGQVSQSIEPLFSNYYVKDLAKAKVPIKNKYLEQVLEERGHNTPEVWNTIMQNDGSVYGLSEEVLPSELKEVFKTFREINQESIIDQAATRQEYIDQGQSLNLMITNDLAPREINQLHIRAWQMGIKSLYYQHSVNQSQEFARNKNCVACEG